MYLGAYDSEESRREYARIVAELADSAPVAQASGRGAAPTVDEMLLAWWMWDENHYRRPDGAPTNQLGEHKQALKPLRALYGTSWPRPSGRSP